MSGKDNERNGRSPEIGPAPPAVGAWPTAPTPKANRYPEPPCRSFKKSLKNPGIVRHRGKIEATVKGARLFLDIESAEGFTPFIWSFTGGRTIQNAFASMKEVPASTPESAAMSKALKKRGFNFCGPVITYAFMQACGLVNDHMTSCPCHARVKALSPGG